ncbi:MAG TPA: dienelactone hydrolase family protein [Propionibacteriaceae bacterium]|nr:dienelactone hydrolase family protein [Propionibacteriaceae bacterium]
MADSITIQSPSGAMPVVRCLPPGGTGPGLVVVQEIFGVSDYVRQRCEDLAGAGYVVYAPELYWRLPEAPQLNEESEEYVQQGMAAAAQLDVELAIEDVCDTFAALRNSPEVQGSSAGLLGYCMGGGLAFAAAARCHPDALVSYYGSALPRLTDLAPQVTCPQLHIWGDADAFIDSATQAEVRQAIEAGGRSVTWLTYEGANHAFDNPHPLFHHAEASAQAWEATLDFLATHLS